MHNPTPVAISKAAASGNQSTSAGAATMGGAFNGIPRSAAGAGVAVTVKASKPADKIAKTRRMTHPSLQFPYTLSRL
jgi:hypothetical protein